MQKIKLGAQSHTVLQKSKITQLEETLFNKIDNFFQEPKVNYLAQETNIQTDVLQRAKQRIQETKSTNPMFFEDGRKKLAALPQKKETFLITAIKSLPKKKKQKKDSFHIPDEPNEQDMLNDLIAQESRPFDDLAELRKMIADTENHMNDYVGEMHRLNHNIGKYNVEARKIGRGVDDYVLDVVDKKCAKFLIKSKTQMNVKQKKY